jgi:hypothetical protein
LKIGTYHKSGVLNNLDIFEIVIVNLVVMQRQYNCLSRGWSSGWASDRLFGWSSDGTDSVGGGSSIGGCDAKSASWVIWLLAMQFTLGGQDGWGQSCSGPCEAGVAMSS